MKRKKTTTTLVLYLSRKSCLREHNLVFLIDGATISVLIGNCQSRGKRDIFRLGVVVVAVSRQSPIKINKLMNKNLLSLSISLSLSLPPFSLSFSLSLLSFLLTSLLTSMLLPQSSCLNLQFVKHSSLPFPCRSNPHSFQLSLSRALVHLPV